MAKQKTAFVCVDCGSEHNKWQGQCQDCDAWNTLSEFRLGPASAAKATASRQGYAGAVGGEVQMLANVSIEALPRQSTGFDEFDRVLGGGLVPGSAVLLGGHPGAGKSTLLLQVLCRLAAQCECLYATGEESLPQIAMRAKRLGLKADTLKLCAETSLNRLLTQAATNKPKVLVVDSIQVLHSDDVSSAPGSVSQVRECA
ncbi:MAG: AAA family ATPase, partial [Gammaproteobacteria bacterium]|nr:AAA family ATPase [Gammaproteobacteria bacterium]